MPYFLVVHNLHENTKNYIKTVREILLSLNVRFMKFNNRILRKILIRDSRAESSIVALYKKLELQNAMEILDTASGDISAAPSIVSLSYVWLLHSSHHSPFYLSRPNVELLMIAYYFLKSSEEKKSSSKLQKKFLAADLRNIHDILSKNMYKIRERVRWRKDLCCMLFFWFLFSLSVTVSESSCEFNQILHLNSWFMLVVVLPLSFHFGANVVLNLCNILWKWH